jgi:hypothetical protein
MIALFVGTIRDVLHGVPLRAGPAARPAADDPVAGAVRLPGVAILVLPFMVFNYAGYNVQQPVAAGAMENVVGADIVLARRRR